MEQKQISLVILGIVAIIAIVGLVLLFQTKTEVTGDYMYDASVLTTEMIPPEPGRPYYTAPVYYMEGHAIPETPQVWLKEQI